MTRTKIESVRDHGDTWLLMLEDRRGVQHAKNPARPKPPAVGDYWEEPDEGWPHVVNASEAAQAEPAPSAVEVPKPIRLEDVPADQENAAQPGTD